MTAVTRTALSMRSWSSQRSDRGLAWPVHYEVSTIDEPLAVSAAVGEPEPAEPLGHRVPMV